MSIKIYKDGKWQILPGQGSPGKSAYDYASENGFVGSEEDFANALGSIDDIADKIENIDTKPTEGSNNLVTSGGVHKALKDLSITGDVDLSNQLNEVEENIDTLYNRTNDNEKNINAIIDILKGEEEWPDDWVPGDSSCCETLREEVSELEDRVSVIESTGGSGTVDVEKLKETFDNRYLVKVEDGEQNVNNDTVFHKNVDIKGDLTVDNIKSADFVSGMAIGGAGFSLYNDETESGKSSVLEVDKLYVRKEAHFEELVIDQIRFSLGETVFSNGGATISEVDDTNPDYYKCYYEKTRQENGKEITGIESGFIVGDLARCQRFDAENNLLKYYWCKVVEVGDDYFCLSKTDKDDTGLDVNISKPEAGDDVVQLGNATKTDRQSAVIISPFNGGSVAIFSGINSYSLSDRNYIGLGTYYEDGKYKSSIYGYGDMYFGVRPGSDGDYIQYKNGLLKIKGDVIIGDGSDIGSVPINGTPLKDLLLSMGDKLDGIDGQIIAYAGTVTEKNNYYNSWIVDEEVAKSHLGDTFYVTEDDVDDGEDDVKKTYKWVLNSDNTYGWQYIEDAQISALYEYLDSKIEGDSKIFTSTPKGDYGMGDIWLNEGKVYVCVSVTGNIENDWEEVDNTNAAEIEDIKNRLESLETTGADSKVIFHFGEEEPNNPDVGDIWYDGVDAWIYKDTGWEKTDSYKTLLEKLANAEEAIDGQIVSFIQNETPTGPYKVGYHWQKVAVIYVCVTSNENETQDLGHWVSVKDSSVNYLKSLFEDAADVYGVLLTDMLAVKNNGDVVAGMYGGGNEENLGSLHDGDRVRMIFAGAKDFPGKDASFNTSIWSDGHLETNSFALNSGKVSISENDIIIGSENTDGQITLGFDNVDGKEIPYLKYSGGSVNNAWDLRNALFTTKENNEYTVEIGEGSIKYESGVWKFDGDLLVSGGVSFYTPLSTDVSDVQSIYWNYLPVDEYFNTTDGTLRLDIDKLSTVIGGSSSGGEGIDSEAVENIIKKYSYSKSETYTQSEINTIIEDLSNVYVKESDVNNRIDSKIEELDFVTRSDFEDYYEGYITVTGSIKAGNIAVFYNDTVIEDSGYSISSITSRIPSKISELTNDSGFVTSTESITGNAGSATVLKTSRKIWGQSFNGSKDVDGELTITTTNGTMKFAGDYDPGIYVDNTKCLAFNRKNGSAIAPNYLYVGRLSSTTTYTLYVSGTAYISSNLTVQGGITFYSQRSLKNIHETDFLSLDQLSNIHAIKYTWKDGRDDRMHVGGIADDIQKIIPEVIYENDGYLTMDYGNAGFVIGTSLIKPVVDHEKRIKELEEEVARLNNLLSA